MMRTRTTKSTQPHFHQSKIKWTMFPPFYSYCFVKKAKITITKCEPLPWKNPFQLQSCFEDPTARWSEARLLSNGKTTHTSICKKTTVYRVAKGKKTGEGKKERLLWNIDDLMKTLKFGACFERVQKASVKVLSEHNFFKKNNLYIRSIKVKSVIYSGTVAAPAVLFG